MAKKIEQKHCTNDFVICKYTVAVFVCDSSRYDVKIAGIIYNSVTSFHCHCTFVVLKCSCSINRRMENSRSVVKNVELSSFAVVLTDGFLFCLDKHAYEIFRLFNAPSYTQCLLPFTHTRIEMITAKIHCYDMHKHVANLKAAFHQHNRLSRLMALLCVLYTYSQRQMTLEFRFQFFALFVRLFINIFANISYEVNLIMDFFIWRCHVFMTIQRENKSENHSISLRIRKFISQAQSNEHWLLLNRFFFLNHFQSFQVKTFVGLSEFLWHFKRDTQIKCYNHIESNIRGEYLMATLRSPHQHKIFIQRTQMQQIFLPMPNSLGLFTVGNSIFNRKMELI